MKHSFNANDFYQQGLSHAKRAEWGRAATCFKQALAIDPKSPAAEYLTMIEDIQAYYYKENFNP